MTSQAQSCAGVSGNRAGPPEHGKTRGLTCRCSSQSRRRDIDVESRRRLGGGLAAERQTVGQATVTFQHPEDQVFFSDLLCEEGESLEKYAPLFDFRDVTKKRSEFQAARQSLLENLRAKHGSVCMLHYSKACTGGRGALTIDHLIPLSSNKLNKELRRLVPLPRRKVPTQSIGSNHMANLVLACATCNGAKKHRLLARAELRRLLAVTSAMFGGSSHALPNMALNPTVGRRRPPAA